ncbi:hypothetical protein QYF36_014703 [Acer negundo]|nr:hypothetical protein QYF36_014703 [Acer negundo]
MSQFIVPNWNLRHQKQEQVEGGESNNRSSSHVNNNNQNNQNPRWCNDDEVKELTWENGQLGLGGTKPTWCRSNDTLESIVHKATSAHNTSNIHLPILKKRSRPQEETKFEHIRPADTSGCASASATATFCRDSDTNIMTWDSYESPTKPLDEDDQECETKAETGRSHSSKRTRAAAVHNQSERRRRDRINQKMKALQKLVPNASKTDKASMLDEVIEYLKQLQAQVQMMSVSRNMPQMMMPLAMQQQLHMALLARMGMGLGLGMGMGMLDINTAISHGAPQSLIHTPPVSATTPTFVPSPFLMPSMIATTCSLPPHQPNSDSTDTNSSVPLPDPYCAFLAQSMNMELCNKMAALYRQQVNQTTQATSSPLQSKHVHQGSQEKKNLKQA